MQTGNILGQYCLVEKIGTGGFGDVWKAHHQEGNWPVAVKLPKTREGAAILTQEGQFAAHLKALKHPNIVEIIDLNTRSSPPYIVYEYIDGEDLASRLWRGKMLVPELLQLAIELLEGLSAAHKQGILHRDIKPSNVLIDRGGTAKIADFGLGRAVEQESLMLTQASMRSGRQPSFARSQVSTQDSHGEIVGTLAYMAPEQRKGESVTAAADLYAVGVVLYEALTGDLPEGVFDEPKVMVPDLPTTANDTIMGLLHSKADRRPSADEAKEAFRRALDGNDIPQATSRRGPEVTTAAQPLRKRWPVLAAVVVILVVIAFSGTRLAPKAQPPPPVPETLPTADPVPPPENLGAAPKLVGLEFEEAKSSAEKQGVQFDVISDKPVEHDTWQRRVVRMQTPQPGDTFTEDKKVRITVGLDIKVPDVVGKSKNSAEQAIRERYFSPVVQYITANSRADKVITQIPAAGNWIKSGATVEIQVGKRSSGGGTGSGYEPRGNGGDNKPPDSGPQGPLRE